MYRPITCIIVDYLFRIKRIEVDCYSNKINKNKYKNFLIRSTKNNFKTSQEHITQDFHTLLLGIKLA